MRLLVITKTIHLQSKGNCDIIDITREVEEQVAGSKIRDGTATIFVVGSTAGITTIEYEPGLVADFKKLWERLAPQNLDYAHNERWHDGNGHAHIRASLLGASLILPMIGGRLALGTWQQVILVDFDNRPRSREVIVQITGE
ncbi:MAG: secondary thiamine-phosphate synthase enzyme YjbQ [Dehalococcoidales bacterium]|nr:secondary thiamine-phosphate synthase enzyme YjbQ [Dehalococcoidales bacterium]